MYTLSKLKNGFTVKFNTSYEAIDLICREIKQFLMEKGLVEFCFDIILGAREALTNAVRHGSKINPLLDVVFTMEADTEQILIRVMDSGPGFDWCGIEGKDTTLAATHGRGIAIFSQYFDLYRFNERGNEVELIKKTRNGDYP